MDPYDLILNARKKRGDDRFVRHPIINAFQKTYNRDQPPIIQSYIS